MTFQAKTKEFVNNDELFNKLEKYVELIEQYNKVMNLTGFSGDTLWEEGIYESLILFEKINVNTIADIGAGAGFPSVPYAIANPNVQITIIEPLEKRITFLKQVVETLGLTNIKLECKRAEDYVGKFDLITARAVASLGILVEITYHLGKVGTAFLFPKGPRAEEEIENAAYSLKRFDLKPFVYSLEKANKKDVRVIVYVKEKEVNAIKLNYAQIAKRYK